MESITATISRQIFASDDSDFRIIQVVDDSNATQTVKGEFPSPQIGCRYKIDGKWIDSGKYGKQFQASSLRFVRPSTRGESIAFLIRVAGMSNTASTKCMDATNESDDPLTRIADMTPDEMSRVTKVRAESCSVYIQKMNRFLKHADVMGELCQMFEGCSIPQTSIQDCVDKWQGQAGEVIRRNPWSLLEIDGIGFSRADAVYKKMGGDVKRLKRQAIAIAYAIAGQESTWMPAPEVATESMKMLGPGERNFAKSVRLGVRSGLLKEYRGESGTMLTLSRWESKEDFVAKKLAEMCSPGQWCPKIDSDPSLSVHQIESAIIATSRGVGCLVGGPGTGKTFTAGMILRALLDSGETSESIGIVAPTGKAAVRLTEVLGGLGLPLSAQTIHSFVGVAKVSRDGSVSLKEDATRDVNVVVVDETSMVPLDLMASLLRSLRNDCKILFLGDTGQLPPIGHGAPLRDIVASGAVPVGRLSEVRRNSGAIVRACADIALRGVYSPCECVRECFGNNLVHVEKTTQKVARLIESIFEDPPPGCNASRDIQVLSPLKKKDAPLGTHQLNLKIRAIVNPGAKSEVPVRGDKVYVKKNTTVPTMRREKGRWSEDGETYAANGEFGVVIDFVEKTKGVELHGTVVELEAPKRTVIIDKPSLLEFGWAVTVHKSQGSEWPIVLYIADTSSAMLGSKQLVYTGISRAKRLAVTVGQLAVLNQQCRKDVIASRRTLLSRKIMEAIKRGGDNVNSTEF